MRQQINPIQRERANDRRPDNVLFRSRPIDDPQTRHAAQEHHDSIAIERHHAAERDKSERVPRDRERQISVEKRDRRARCPTSETRPARRGQEKTSRPHQSKRQPDSSAGQRRYGYCQPDQFMIETRRRHPTPNNTHWALLVPAAQGWNDLKRSPPELAIRTPKRTARVPQQTITGRKTARTALPVLISCARARPSDSSTMQ